MVRHEIGERIKNAKLGIKAYGEPGRDWSQGELDTLQSLLKWLSPAPVSDAAKKTK